MATKLHKICKVQSLASMQKIRTVSNKAHQTEFHHHLQLKKVQGQVDHFIEMAKSVEKKVNVKTKKWAEMTLKDYVAKARDNYPFFILGVGILFMDYKKLLIEPEARRKDAGKKEDAVTEDAGTAITK